MARIAKSLDVLRSQINARWPERNKGSDGWIGDVAHSQRNSDHNPNAAGVVCAFDVTHDPSGGPNAGKLAEDLIASRDPRIKYIISNKRICSGEGGPSPWKWRAYSGSNPHTKHVHISVAAEKALYDSAKRWTAIKPLPKPVDPTPPPPDIEPTPPPAPSIPWWKRPFVWLGGVLAGGGLGAGSLSVDGKFFLGLSAFVVVAFVVFLGWVYLVPPRGKIRK